MNFTLDLNTFISALGVALVVAAIKGIWALNTKVAVQNGRLGAIETWLTGHEKLDDERHKQTQETLYSLRGKLDGE